ncbi:MAG: hypothetical protein WBM61_10975 [Woeseiaceae bacterium]
MNASYDNSAAVVVLPPVSGGRLQDRSLRAWLAQSDLRRVPGNRELLEMIVGVLDLPYPDEGLAALRMWGQTGERPTVWLAAADPVYLEPRLDHLCLHASPSIQMPPSDFGALIQHLQETLGDEQRFGFIRLGNSGYLRAENPLSTARVPPYLVDQKVPSDYLPEGEDAATYRNLLSEIEMSLHDHEVNQRRIAAGQQPVNSLWLWGGGLAPPRQTRPQPRLFANDPLLLGYWDSANAVAKLWPGSIAECIDAGQRTDFVAVAPDQADDTVFLEDCLRQLRAALREKRLNQLTLLFRDGLRADVTRSHRLRFWRRDANLLD